MNPDLFIEKCRQSCSLVCLHKNTSCCIVPRTAVFSEQRNHDLQENEYVISSSSSSLWRMPVKDDCRSSFPFRTFIFLPYSRSLCFPTLWHLSPPPLSLSLPFKTFLLPEFSFGCSLFLHSLPSLLSSVFLWLVFYLSVQPSCLFSYLGNSNRYLQFSFVDILVTALQSSLQFSPRVTGMGNYWCVTLPFSL